MPSERGRHTVLQQRQITSLNTSTNLATTLTTDPAIDGVWLQAVDNNVSANFAGGTPTASNGGILYAGAAFQYFPVDPSSINVIEVSASAKLNVIYVSEVKAAFRGT